MTASPFELSSSITSAPSLMTNRAIGGGSRLASCCAWGKSSHLTINPEEHHDIYPFNQNLAALTISHPAAPDDSAQCCPLIDHGVHAIRRLRSAGPRRPATSRSIPAITRFAAPAICYSRSLGGYRQQRPYHLGKRLWFSGRRKPDPGNP